MSQADVSTHSRAEAAALRRSKMITLKEVSTHSRAEAAANSLHNPAYSDRFQHTAARRRLPFRALKL